MRRETRPEGRRDDFNSLEALGVISDLTTGFVSSFSAVSVLIVEGAEELAEREAVSSMIEEEELAEKAAGSMVGEEELGGKEEEELAEKAAGSMVGEEEFGVKEEEELAAEREVEASVEGSVEEREEFKLLRVKDETGPRWVEACNLTGRVLAEPKALNSADKTRKPSPTRRRGADMKGKDDDNQK
jgi:hypothetical protein